MYDYNTLINEFLQYKRFLGYKYNSDEIVLNQIKKFLINNNVEIITKEVTKKFARINTNLTSNCLARNMGTFRELCYYLKYQKNIECYQIPKKLYPQNQRNFRPYIFSHEEIKKIYANLDFIKYSYHYSYYAQITYPLIIKILYQTGMRIGEVLNLKIKDYNYELGIFTLKETKNNEERNVAISNSLKEVINDFILKFNKTNDDKLFEINVSTIENYFKKVLYKSNITITARLHDLRFAFIIHNIEFAIKRNDNLDNYLPILAAQVGHKSLNSLSYYFHITNDILNEVTNISNKELGYLIQGDDFDEK